MNVLIEYFIQKKYIGQVQHDCTICIISTFARKTDQIAESELRFAKREGMQFKLSFLQASTWDVDWDRENYLSRALVALFSYLANWPNLVYQLYSIQKVNKSINLKF